MLKGTVRSSRAKDSWNERFQDALSMPVATEQDRLNKYNFLNSVNKDFIANATVYAETIISELFLEHKSIPIYQVGGQAGGKKYLWRNIFFKLVDATKGPYHCDEEAAAKAMAHEMKSANSYFRCGILDIHVALQAVIDLNGFRMIAQAYLPIESIDGGGSVDTRVLGIADGILSKPTGNIELRKRSIDALQYAAQELNIREHTVQGETMYSACDVEGHIGKDDKFYILDLARTFPPEAPSISQHLIQKSGYHVGQVVVIVKTEEVGRSEPTSGSSTPAPFVRGVSNESLGKFSRKRDKSDSCGLSTSSLQVKPKKTAVRGFIYRVHDDGTYDVFCPHPAPPVRSRSTAALSRSVSHHLMGGGKITPRRHDVFDLLDDDSIDESVEDKQFQLAHELQLALKNGNIDDHLKDNMLEFLRKLNENGAGASKDTAPVRANSRKFGKEHDSLPSVPGEVFHRLTDSEVKSGAQSIFWRLLRPEFVKHRGASGIEAYQKRQHLRQVAIKKVRSQLETLPTLNGEVFTDEEILLAIDERFAVRRSCFDTYQAETKVLTMTTNDYSSQLNQQDPDDISLLLSGNKSGTTSVARFTPPSTIHKSLRKRHSAQQPVISMVHSMEECVDELMSEFLPVDLITDGFANASEFGCTRTVAAVGIAEEEDTDEFGIGMGVPIDDHMEDLLDSSLDKSFVSVRNSSSAFSRPSTIVKPILPDGYEEPLEEQFRDFIGKQSDHYQYYDYDSLVELSVNEPNVRSINQIPWDRVIQLQQLLMDDCKSTRDETNVETIVMEESIGTELLDALPSARKHKRSNNKQIAKRKGDNCVKPIAVDFSGINNNEDFMFHSSSTVNAAAVPLSSDALSSFSVADPDCKLRNDEVEQATKVLINELIPAVADDIMLLGHPLHRMSLGYSLTEYIHCHGINIRHVGLLRSHINPWSSVVTSRAATDDDAEKLIKAQIVIRHDLLLECVIRTLKHILRNLLRRYINQNKNDSNQLSVELLITQFFNLITGAHPLYIFFWRNIVTPGLFKRFGSVTLSSDEHDHDCDDWDRQHNANALDLLLQYIVQRPNGFVRSGAASEADKASNMFSVVQANGSLVDLAMKGKGSRLLELCCIVQHGSIRLIIEGVCKSGGVNISPECRKSLKRSKNMVVATLPMDVDLKNLESSSNQEALVPPIVESAVDADSHEQSSLFGFQFAISDIVNVVPVVKYMHQVNLARGIGLLLESEQHSAQGMTKPRVQSSKSTELVSVDDKYLPQKRRHDHASPDSLIRLANSAMGILENALKSMPDDMTTKSALADTCLSIAHALQRKGDESARQEAMYVKYRGLCEHTRCCVSKLSYKADILGIVVTVDLQVPHKKGKHDPASDLIVMPQLYIKSVTIVKTGISLSAFLKLPKLPDQKKVLRFLPLIIEKEHFARSEALLKEQMIRFVCLDDKHYQSPISPKQKVVIKTEDLHIEPYDVKFGLPLPSFTAEIGLSVISALMNEIVMDYCQKPPSDTDKLDFWGEGIKSIRFQSSEYFASYARLHHMLLQLSSNDPSWKELANTMVKRFIDDPSARTKANTKNIGTFLIYLLVSDYEWTSEFADLYLREALSRQVAWYLGNPFWEEQKKAGTPGDGKSRNNSVADSTENESEETSKKNAYLELGILESSELVSPFRLVTTFNATKGISLRSLMFQVYFMLAIVRKTTSTGSSLTSSNSGCLPSRQISHATMTSLPPRMTSTSSDVSTNEGSRHGILLQLYNSSLGKPTAAMRSNMYEEFENIIKVSNYEQFLDKIGLKKTPHQFCTMLRLAVHDSIKNTYLKFINVNDLSNWKAAMSINKDNPKVPLSENAGLLIDRSVRQCFLPDTATWKEVQDCYNACTAVDNKVFEQSLVVPLRIRMQNLIDLCKPSNRKKNNNNSNEKPPQHSVPPRVEVDKIDWRNTTPVSEGVSFSKMVLSNVTNVGSSDSHENNSIPAGMPDHAQRNKPNNNNHNIHNNHKENNKSKQKNHPNNQSHKQDVRSEDNSNRPKKFDPNHRKSNKHMSDDLEADGETSQLSNQHQHQSKKNRSSASKGNDGWELRKSPPPNPIASTYRGRSTSDHSSGNEHEHGKVGHHGSRSHQQNNTRHHKPKHGDKQSAHNRGAGKGQLQFTGAGIPTDRPNQPPSAVEFPPLPPSVVSVRQESMDSTSSRDTQL